MDGPGPRSARDKATLDEFIAGLGRRVDQPVHRAAELPGRDDVSSQTARPRPTADLVRTAAARGHRRGVRARVTGLVGDHTGGATMSRIDGGGSPRTRGLPIRPRRRCSSSATSHKEFGAVRANDAVDLDVPPADLHGLLGENGAGKSTLMKVLSGFIRADDGEVELDGKALTLSSPVTRSPPASACCTRTRSCSDRSRCSTTSCWPVPAASASTATRGPRAARAHGRALRVHVRPGRRGPRSRSANGSSWRSSGCSGSAPGC